MHKFKIPLIIFFILLATLQVYSAQNPKIPLSQWVSLRSDAREQVRKIIRAEVDNREGFSTSQEEKANLDAVEDEKEKQDTGYKRSIVTANKEFIRAKKGRDDLTTQFQAASTELEEQQKNIKTIKAGIENLDSQTARYNQDVRTQQESLKKWLQTEKQGEALVAVIFTRGFKDKAHTLESMADKVSAPLMAQYMGTYIQSYTTVINAVLSVDFIRAIEEGTAKWNNEEPLRIELEKGNKGTTYLRLKRYELYPFQPPKGGSVASKTASGNLKAVVVTNRKELDGFLTQNGYSPASYALDRADSMIKETTQMNAAAGESLNEQVRSFRERINSLQEKIASAKADKETQLSILAKKEEQYKKTAQETTAVQSNKEEADRAFQETQKVLHDIRRVRESIIIKTALTTARGSQTPAEVSAEAIIDKLAEVKNDAKTQHSSSTTEVTNFQVSAESSFQAVTEARITAVRLISFINEGDSVRVKMAFRVNTVMEEPGEEAPKVKPRPARKAPEETDEEAPKIKPQAVQKTPDETEEEAVGEKPQPTPKAPEGKFSRFIPSFMKKGDDQGEKTTKEPEAVKPPKEPVKRNPKALGNAEANDVLFEVINVKESGNEISVFVDLTNMAEEDPRSVALYDANFKWVKSKIMDASGKEYDVSQVVFWKEQQKTSIYEAGKQGVPIEAKTKQTAQLIFKKVPSNMKAIKKLTIHPFVYWRVVFVWKWQEHDLVFQNIRVGR
jgi:hypothetical protein